jgi:hypothetical protein
VSSGRTNCSSLQYYICAGVKVFGVKDLESWRDNNSVCKENIFQLSPSLGQRGYPLVQPSIDVDPGCSLVSRAAG